ncbi:MAG: hypothetical protein H6629_12130 [Calditrichae bacterium]|nr:hypothetical protein [Calditrichia bacterium]
MYLPLITAETGSTIKHILLPFIGEYRANGLGIPDSAAIAILLISLGTPQAVAAAQAQATVQGMIAGINPQRHFNSDSLTITAAEETALIQAVAEFNQIISALQPLPESLVDANAKLTELNQSASMDLAADLFFSIRRIPLSAWTVSSQQCRLCHHCQRNHQKNSLSADISIPLVNADDFRGHIPVHR